MKNKFKLVYLILLVDILDCG